MDAELKKKWVDALRSGKYIQGKSKLKQIEDGVTKHCCLGVLCEVMGERDDIEIKADKIITICNSGEIVFRTDGVLTPSIYEEIGMSEMEHNYYWQMNDNFEFSFNQIADYIEQKAE